MKFPIYRKYKNNNHFFKIMSMDEFEEISFIGKKLIVTLHQVTILPDRNFISDLLHDIGNTAEIATEEEYQQILTLK